MVSACAQIGVSVIAAWPGTTIGPPAAMLYAVDPVGVAMMRPSARYAAIELVVAERVDLDQPRHRALMEHRIVERVAHDRLGARRA